MVSTLVIIIIIITAIIAVLTLTSTTYIDPGVHLTKVAVAELLDVDEEMVSKNIQSRSILHTVISGFGGSSGGGGGGTNEVKTTTDPEKGTTTIETEDTTIILTEKKIGKPVTKPVSLYRQIIFDDRTTDGKKLDAAAFQLLKVKKLNFIAIEGDDRPLNDGSISFVLSLPIDKPVKRIQGEFVVILNQDLVDRILFDGGNSVVPRHGYVELLKERYVINKLLNGLAFDTHTLQLRIDELSVEYRDGTTEFTTPKQIIYSVDFEKSNTETIKKDENGDFTKTFDFDVPITISSLSQTVDVQICRDFKSFANGWGCIAYDSVAVIPAPALGAVTITDIHTNEVVATYPAHPAQNCTQNIKKLVVVPVTDCKRLGEEPFGMIFSADPGKSYHIDVSDPQRSWNIRIPASGGPASYDYTCIDQRTAEVLSDNAPHGLLRYAINSETVCNFPQQR